MEKNKIVIGTRGSVLALAQAEKVKEMLETEYEKLRKSEEVKEIEGFSEKEKLEIELKIIVTTGDKDFRDFSRIQGTTQKDLFVKEIEKEILEGKIDLAVHSLKDMPQITPSGLINACFPLREDNRDVLVSRKGKKLHELPSGSIIGTGSTRRKAELLNIEKNLNIKGIRGNIHTRLRKLDEGEYDAIVLAAAGLKRTGMTERITEYFHRNDFMPAPGQGILCIQCRENDMRIRNILKIIDNDEVRTMCETEREFSRIFDGGCHTPVGCSSEIVGDTITVKGMYYNRDGKRIFSEIKGSRYEGIKLAGKLAERIKKSIDKKGKVYIAGAGCGDEKLITVKLKEIINQVECIIYDRLVNENILQYAQPDAELIYMGKTDTEGGELQKEINETIIRKSKEGLKVLRLKGGDPFVFGRGGEEIESLVSEGIDFEVIPGITSAVAVPSYAGIPVTHRGVNTSFHVFTGHLKTDGEDPDFPLIAKLKGTIIFLMGLSNIEKITENLIRYGKDRNTPVAVIKDGTTSKQNVYMGTLETISETVRKNEVKSPVIIVIGETVNLREKMKWFEKKPLYSKNIMITRNKEKQEEIISVINSLGGQGISLPFINIKYIDFEMPDLSEYEAILFNSINSVVGFMGKINDMRVLGNIRIGAVGEKTVAELKKYKIVPDFFPEEYTAEKLACESVNFTKEKAKVLFVVSDISPVNTERYTELYNRNFEKLIVYDTQKIDRRKETTEKYLDKCDILMFLSSSAFEAFALSLKLDIKTPEVNREKLQCKLIASIGPVTTKTVEKYGLKVEIEAKRYTEEGLLEAILEKMENNKNK